MKIVLCNIPIRSKADSFPPVGVTRLIDSLHDAGYTDVKFFNIDLERPGEREIIDFFLGESPDLIGFSAVVSTSYAYVKWLSGLLRKVLPKASIILGGNMAASAEIILKKCNIDLCVVGEGEKTIVKLCRHWEKYGSFAYNTDLGEIPGIVCKQGEDKGVMFTGFAEQLSPERIRQANYHIVGGYYLTDPFERIGFSNDPRSYQEHRRGKKAAYLELSKGCVSRCTFCHRWSKGYRVIDIDNVFRDIRYLQDEFDVGFFCFMDECFGADREYLDEFLRRISQLDILWHVAGMRVKAVDAELLMKLRDAGCVSVYFGIESGSDRMLKIMEKGVTVADNLKAIQAVKDAGLTTVIQLVIGMPGENWESIRETISFVRKANEILGDVETSVNYAQILPGTPVYEYARLHRLIGSSLDEEEQYLLKISNIDAGDESHYINVSSESRADVFVWKYLIQRECSGHLAGREARVKSKVVEALLKVVGEPVTYFLIKAWRCHRFTGSIAATLELLKEKPPIMAEVKSKSLRRIVRETAGLRDKPVMSGSLPALRESM